MLELNHLTKRYHPNQPPVVDDLSLTVHRGEMLVWLGPSGGGKTTPFPKGHSSSGGIWLECG
jgi:ABC-type Fe3+/spermidine/putrescine transport system ATPase subunit